MQNLYSTIISQFANSPRLTGILEKYNAAVDPSADIDNFYTHVWDVNTAQGFGLDIWGRIVGVSRVIPTTPPTYLQDAEYLELVLLKALSNISIASSQAINVLLTTWMAGRGVCFVSDLGNMQILYQFEFALEPFEVAIITQSGIFLRPAGVGGWMVNTVYPAFGFSEMGTTWAAPFGQAPFLSAGQPLNVS